MARGDDVMSGGDGRDAFWISPGDDDDHITDFSRGNDIIDLSDFDFRDIGDLSIANSGNGSIINLGHGDSIMVNYVTASQWVASDFWF